MGAKLRILWATDRMKVKDLLAQLNNYSPDMEVHFAHSSPGQDHWITPSVEGVGVSHVIWSFQHNSSRLTESPAEQDMGKEAVILFP